MFAESWSPAVKHHSLFKFQSFSLLISGVSLFLPCSSFQLCRIFGTFDALHTFVTYSLHTVHSIRVQIQTACKFKGLTTRCILVDISISSVCTCTHVHARLPPADPKSPPTPAGPWSQRQGGPEAAADPHPGGPRGTGGGVGQPPAWQQQQGVRVSRATAKSSFPFSLGFLFQ